jgi:plastocyanin
MRARHLLIVLSLIFATSSFAKDIYISVSGKANGFFSDARIFNPSFDKDIVVTARYLPSGNGDNSGAGSVQLTIPKRTMKVYDDAVQSMFGGGPPLGAIRLTSDDDFVATQRIYADRRADRQGGTLGQFVPGLELSTALNKGVLIQLKSGQASLGSFRTNWGGINPNATVANIAFKLYDKDNNLAGTNNLTMQPFGVMAPTNITGFFGNPNRDLTDAWIAFESDQPVFFYASVVDNGADDPTFITASADSGVAPNEPPPPESVTIVASDFQFDMQTSGPIRAGQPVNLVLSKSNGAHTFILFSQNGGTLRSVNLTNNAQTIEVTFPTAGTYAFACGNSGCGSGHFSMTGEINVE